MKPINKGIRKILLIHHGTHNAGAPISAFNTAIGLKNSGFSVDVGLVWPSKENLRYFGKSFTVFNMSFVPLFFYCVGGKPNPLDPRVIRYRLRNLLKLGRLWKSEWKGFKQYDLIYVNSITAFPLVNYLIFKKFKVVWHIREHGLNTFSLINYFQRKTLKRTRHLIFLSNADKKSWGVKHGQVVPNWISWEDELKEEVSINETIHLLYVGGKNKVKGASDILRLSRHIKDSNLNVCLSIYGWPLSIVPMDLRGDEKIKFHSFNPNLSIEFLRAHILLYPANLPHFSRPIVEAMLSRTFVIAKKNCSTVEHLDGGKYGLLVDDKTDYTTKVMKLLTRYDKDNHKMKRTIDAAYKYAKMKYSRDKNLREIVSVVKECLSES